MTATDRVQKLFEALVGIVDADATARTLCGGRTSGILVPWETTEHQSALPVVCYQLITAVPGGGNAPQWTIDVQFDAFAEGDDAQSTANSLAERIEVGITAPLLAGKSLDAAPLRVVRRGGPMIREASRLVARATVTTTFALYD